MFRLGGAGSLFSRPIVSVTALRIAATTQDAKRAIDAAAGDRYDVIGAQVLSAAAVLAPRVGGDRGACPHLMHVPVASLRGGAAAARAVTAAADDGTAAEAASC
jgi:hypothetical protein